MEVLYTLLGLAIGFAMAWLLSKNQRETISSQKEEISSLKADIAHKHEVIVKKSGEITDITVENSTLTERNANLEAQLGELREQTEEKIAEIRNQADEQLKSQLELISAQVKTISEEVLTKRSKELADHNKSQISEILNPLKTSIDEMRQRVDTQEKEHIDRIARLDASIKTTLSKADEVGRHADRLAEALTSENKTQGNFGETQLRTILEHLDMEEGVQFEEQPTMRNATGEPIINEESNQRMQPDFIIHFPDRRDVIVDSKVSLKAFVDYHNATTDKERDDAVRRHVASVRSHFMELSKKNYTGYNNGENNSFSMVIMFVFSESALQLALSNSPTIWQDAFYKGVIITGPQSIYMFLRLVQQSWISNRQLTNQKEIIATAETLMSRIQILFERFGKVRNNLDRTAKSFDEVDNSLRDSGKSVATSARRLVELGVQQDKNHKPLDTKRIEGE